MKHKKYLIQHITQRRSGIGFVVAASTSETKENALNSWYSRYHNKFYRETSFRELAVCTPEGKDKFEVREL